ncbi:hypothetical protein CEXT_547281, partial [Caerostris extrusa]
KETELLQQDVVKKRKQWIKALEIKADELASTNIHLQQEVKSLRSEVAHLKKYADGS